MRKSLGDKRKELSPKNIATIVKLHGEFEDADPEYSKIFANEDFGYRTITIEQPLRLNYAAHPDRIDTALEQKPIARLDDATKADIRSALTTLDASQVWTNRSTFDTAIGRALGTAGVGLTPAQRRALLQGLSAADPEAETVTGAKGRIEPDTSLRDTENVPLSENIEAYFAREVQLHVPEAWIDHDRTRTGYEIPLTRHFYTYTPQRPLKDIDADIQQIITEIETLFAQVKA